ncbi:MAG: hypothetical protein KAG89_20115 [Fulvimarina manganoxydans]|uniref:helix-turn-helix transcriptional regulator n=1 Tax=Fulvimarina manganoxydans TaxID=937218 RepID=UPI002356395C|nr:hypothetical protein [Fulvimarina manganoxydans]MCK5934464.1 hypothetical protein [Fulvimarina manganoxydans]
MSEPKARNLRPDPIAYAPRGLSKMEAARWIGVSVRKFEDMVSAGDMPKPKRLGSRVVWDRYLLDAAFADLDEAPAANLIDLAQGCHR